MPALPGVQRRAAVVTAPTPVAAWRWALGLVGLLALAGGTVLAYVLFSGGGGAPGLFGGCGIAACGLVAVLVAKEGAL